MNRHHDIDSHPLIINETMAMSWGPWTRSSHTWSAQSLPRCSVPPRMHVPACYAYGASADLKQDGRQQRIPAEPNFPQILAARLPQSRCRNDVRGFYADGFASRDKNLTAWPHLDAVVVVRVFVVLQRLQNRGYHLTPRRRKQRRTEKNPKKKRHLSRPIDTRRIRP